VQLGGLETRPQLSLKGVGGSGQRFDEAKKLLKRRFRKGLDL
jgi:hypothetical protein